MVDGPLDDFASTASRGLSRLGTVALDAADELRGRSIVLCGSEDRLSADNLGSPAWRLVNEVNGVPSGLPSGLDRPPTSSFPVDVFVRNVLGGGIVDVGRLGDLTLDSIEVSRPDEDGVSRRSTVGRLFTGGLTIFAVELLGLLAEAVCLSDELFEASLALAPMLPVDDPASVSF